jgi:hypothetical protein
MNDRKQSEKTRKKEEDSSENSKFDADPFANNFQVIDDGKKEEKQRFCVRSVETLNYAAMDYHDLPHFSLHKTGIDVQVNRPLKIHRERMPFTSFPNPPTAS